MRALCVAALAVAVAACQVQPAGRVGGDEPDDAAADGSGGDGDGVASGGDGAGGPAAGSDDAASGAEDGEPEGEDEGEGEGEDEGEGEGEGEGDPEGGDGAEGEGEGEPLPAVPPAAGDLLPLHLDLGAVPVGDVAGPGRLDLRSVGGAALSGVTPSLAAEGFALEHDCPGELAAGASCALHVRCTPPAPGLQVGVVRVAFANAPAVAAVVQAAGLAPGAARVVYVGDPGGIDFGEVRASAVREAAFFNAGESPTGDLLAVTEGAAFGVDDDGCSFRPLGPGEGCTVTVRFGPPADGRYDGELRLWGDVPVRVPLRGSAADVDDAGLEVAPPAVDFGATGPNQEVRREVRVRNPGGRPLDGLRLRVEGDPGFSLLDPGGAGQCARGAVLPGGGTCVATLRFAPGAGGAHRAELFVGGVGVADVVVGLLGEGRGFEPATLRTAPPGQLVDFGRSADPVRRTVVVENSGDAPTGALRVRVSGEGFSGLAEGAAPCAGALLGPGQRCDVVLEFAPARNGDHPGALRISDGPRELVVALMGIGEGFGPPVLSVDPPLLDFQIVNAGAEAGPRPVRVRNAGDRAAQGLSVTVEGAAAGDYALSRPPNGGCPEPGAGGALAAGQVCTVLVTFRPRAEGERLAEVRAAADEAPPAFATLVGAGRGFAPAALVWRGAPDPDFGNVHDPVRRQFWVQNLGGRASGNLAIRLVGAPEFRIDPGDDDCAGRTLGPLAECGVTVTFATADNGEYAGVLTVEDRDGGDLLELAARSVGWLPADLVAAPDTLQFGDLGDLLASPPRTAVVTNAGELPVAGIDVALRGAAAGVFSLRPAPPAAPPGEPPYPAACRPGADLTGGQACSVTVVLTPGDDPPVGSWSASVVVGNAANAVEIALSGRRGVAASCKEIKDADPAAASGLYLVDLDGVGGADPGDVWCEMDAAGGGWMVFAYLRAQAHWSWTPYTDAGRVGDVAGGFAQGATFQRARPGVTEKIIIYNKLIEQGVDLGRHFMAVRRTANDPISFDQIHAAADGWIYYDSRGVSVDARENAGNICTHNCNGLAGHGMFHDWSGIGYHGTQSGDYGCRDGNNICWRSHGQGCNVGAGRCAHLRGQGEGVLYGVR